MRDLVFVWDLIRTDDRARLKEHVRWEGTDRVVYDPRPELPRDAFRIPYKELGVTVIASGQTRQHWLEHFTHGDVLTPALYHLAAGINAWMSGLTDARLCLDDSQPRPKTRIVPNSLLGARWLQFHLSVSNDTEYRQCGFGGSFSVRYPAISGAMVSDKCDFIERTDVDAVVATDAGCLMNVGGCLRRRGSKVRTLHLAEVLAAT